MLEKLNEKIKSMKAYLLLKFEEDDMHAVWDAAIDIQGLKDQVDVLQTYKKENND